MLGFSRRLMSGISRRLPGNGPSRPSTWYGLKLTLGMMLVLVLPLLQSTVRQVHQINCPYNYFHTDGPLMFNAPAFEAASRVKTAQSFKQSGFVDTWMNWVPTTALTDFTPDTTYYLDKLQGRELAYIFMTWDSKLGMMVVQLYPRDVLNNRWKLYADSSANWDYDHGAQIWIRCRPSWQPDSNRATIAFLNQKMVEHLRPWLPTTATAAAITADTDRHLEYHNTHLGQFLVDKQKFWVSLIGMFVMLMIHLSGAFSVRKHFDYLRQQMRGDDYDLPRVSIWRLWAAWDVRTVISWYKADLEERRRQKRLAIRMQGRENLVENVVFDLAARTLPDFERQLNGRTIPPRLQRYWNRANDDKLKLELRLEAFDRLRRWLAEETRTAPLLTNTDQDYRQQLLARTKAIKDGSLPPDVRRKILEADEQFAMLRDDPRHHLGNYWLERIIELATPKVVEPVHEVAPSPKRTGKPAEDPLPRDLDDVVELFDVRDLLPAGIDHDHVRGIIVWGLLRPGQRGRSMFKARYITIQWLRADVQSKLGSDYDPIAYDRAFDFLKRTRVIMTDHKAKRHQPVAALNPHFAQGVDQGVEIIRRVLAMRDVLTDLSRT